MAQVMPALREGLAIKTAVITRQRDFDSLFAGFTEMRAISYVSSASLLLGFLDERGFERIELVVGDSVDSKHLKDDLSQRELATTVRLASEVEAGRLRILLPKTTIHSKLFILSGKSYFRLIVTSANLTETARKASRQTNYAWYADVPPAHPMLLRVEEDYQGQSDGAALFMGDLLELFRKREQLPRSEVISIWLGSQVDDDDLGVARAIVQGLASEALAHPGEEERPVIRIDLPTTAEARRQTLRLLAPLGVDGRARDATFSPATVIRYVEEAHGVPLMRVDVPRQEVWLGFRGRIERLDSDLPSPGEIDQALADLEAYVRTVEIGQCPDALFAKASVYEAILYALAAVFAHEQMAERRRRYGIVNRRGTRFLYVYGPAQNGKTTFLRYVLKLITGDLVDPLTPSRFTKAHVRAVQRLGTSFPLMFDDMASTTSRTFEDIVKSHWETEWRDGTPCPQIIFTSNSLNLRDWAKSRLKRVDFDVHFVPTTSSQEQLARILERPNRIFRWFARLYLEKIQSSGWLSDDEMATARDVMGDLYAFARRDVPPYYPQRPLEELYDPDLRAWKDLLRQRKVVMQRQQDQTTVTFRDDLQHHEVQEYCACLPQTVKTKRIGKTVVVENPRFFHQWLEGGRMKSGWWRGLLKRRT